MTGVAGMLLTGVLRMDEAYAAINWKTVFLMACLIPLGWAMDSSGAAAWVAGTPSTACRRAFRCGLLELAVALLTTAFSLVISHVGATIVMVPMAINLALAAGGNPTAFALIVALSASNNLMTASNPVISMITGPANYTPRELWRVGGPLSLLYTFPVRRIYCVGRNFADHAREMGAAVPASKADRGQPVFFLKPADAVVTDGADIPYPTRHPRPAPRSGAGGGLGRDAPAGVLPLSRSAGAGDCLWRRPGPDPPRPAGRGQGQGPALGHGKGFDHSAPISELVPAARRDAGNPQPQPAGERPGPPARLTAGPDLGRARYPARTVAAVCAESRRPGVHGHPAGVAAAASRATTSCATLEGVAELRGRIVADRMNRGRL
jgi:hypothetical protein